MSEKQDVERAEESVEAVQKQLNDLTAQFETESAELAARIDPATEELDTIIV